MIPLSLQFSLIGYSFLFGILFFLFYYFLKKLLYCDNVYFRILNTFSFILLSTLLYFLGLERISDGILHIYSLFLICAGFIVGDVIARKIKK